MKLINDISSDLQKLFKYFNGGPILAFLKIPFPPSHSVFSNELGLYYKDLNLLSLATSTSNIVASSFE